LRVVEQLLDEGVEGRLLLDVGETAAYIAMEDQSLAVVILPTKRGDDLLDAMIHQLGRNPKVHHKLVMVGGGEDMRPLLEACQPGLLSRRMVQVYQLADDGQVWSGRGSRLDSSVGRVLEATRGFEGSVDVEALTRRIHAPPEEDVERFREHRTFVQAYRGVRPSVTIGAVALILGVFGLQMTWGGGAFIPTMVRMGANTETSLGTEPWRLLSSTLLHGNGLHVLMNAFVLYVLGAHLERILGWRRQLVLLVAAGLFGSLASAVRGEALLSVGASGAIWGLLGAALGLAMRPGGLLPAAIVQELKRAALFNLIINLAFSFQPGIDLMAHLGGGMVGAAASFSGVLTRGLRPVAEDPARRHDSGRGWTVAAWVASSLTVASLVVACVVGRPWELGRAPQLGEVALEGTPFRVRASADPARPVEREEFSDGAVVFTLGDALVDAVAVGVVVQPWSEPGPFDATDVEAWRGRKPSLDEGVEVVASRNIEDAAVPAYEEVHQYPNGGRLYVRYHLFEDVEVVVNAFVFDGARDDVTTAAKAAVASLERTP